MSLLRANLLSCFLLSGLLFSGEQSPRTPIGESSKENPAAGKAKEASEEDIQKWVRELGNDKFAVREAAMASLLKAGPRAMPAVFEATKSKDSEVQARASKVAKLIEASSVKALQAFGVKVGSQCPTGITIYSKPGFPFTDQAMELIVAFPQLENLSLWHLAVTDEGMKYVGKLKSLKRLWISDCSIGDEGVKHLADLRSLASLTLYNCRLSGRGLAFLNTPVLHQICLDGSKITDAGLVSAMPALTKLSNLQYLGVSETEIGDKSLGHIAQLLSLTRLDLSRTRITDAGIKQIGQLKALSYLGLAGTRVTDNGLAHVAQLAELEKLDLSATQISDKGLAHVLSIKSLTSLWLDNTPQLPLSALEKLRSMPNLEFLCFCGKGAGEFPFALDWWCRPVAPHFGFVKQIDKAGKTIKFEVLTATEINDEITLDTAEGKIKETCKKYINELLAVFVYSFDELPVYDKYGKRLPWDMVRQRLGVGTTVLLSKDGKMIHKDYLRVVADDVVILVPPHPGVQRELIQPKPIR